MGDDCNSQQTGYELPPEQKLAQKQQLAHMNHILMLLHPGATNPVQSQI